MLIPSCFVMCYGETIKFERMSWSTNSKTAVVIPFNLNSNFMKDPQYGVLEHQCQKKPRLLTARVSWVSMLFYLNTIENLNLDSGVTLTGSLWSYSLSSEHSCESCVTPPSKICIYLPFFFFFFKAQLWVGNPRLLNKHKPASLGPYFVSKHLPPLHFSFPTNFSSATWILQVFPEFKREEGNRKWNRMG